MNLRQNKIHHGLHGYRCVLEENRRTRPIRVRPIAGCLCQTPAKNHPRNPWFQKFLHSPHNLALVSVLYFSEWAEMTTQ